MPEIKIRAWSKVLKSMSSPGFLSLWFAAMNKMSASEVRELKDILIFTQWVGQYDKNGKEIYVGDILRTVTKGRTYIGAMEYVPERLVFGVYSKKQSDDPDTMTVHVKDDGMPEIIGNIFEDPELLTEDN